MSTKSQSINPTVEVQDGGTVVGPRRALNLGDGLSITSDSDGVVTLEAAGSEASVQPIRVETDNYTVVTADLGYLLRLQTTDAVNLVVLGNTVAVGFWVDLAFEGALRLQMSSLPGVTALSRGGRTEFNGQYARARAEYIEANTWLLDGDLVVPVGG